MTWDICLVIFTLESIDDEKNKTTHKKTPPQTDCKSKQETTVLKNFGMGEIDTLDVASKTKIKSYSVK